MSESFESFESGSLERFEPLEGRVVPLGGARAALRLELRVRDPELVAELEAHAPGAEREAFALSALRIGVLALRGAQGRLDADAVRHESERLLGDLQQRLGEHQQAVALHLAQRLGEYFDPGSGRFHERVERLVRPGGELEQVLRRQVGLEDSELGRTLAAHLGDASPLLAILRPDAPDGLLASLGRSVEEALAGERERLLAEFSLDNREGALARLLGELGQQSGRLGEELRQLLEAEREKAARFQQEVAASLAALQARRDEAARSTRHGGEFEAEVFAFAQRDAGRAGDVASHVANTTGEIRSCKVGDVVVELGPESAAPRARIVIEAKERAGVDLRAALAELDQARKNRAAEVGLFVFSKRTAPPGLEPFRRHGSDVVVVWDAEDPGSDVLLAAGLSVARALCTRAAAQREAREADFSALDAALREIERQAGGFDEITTLTQTIQGHSEKILKRARIMREGLAAQLEILEENLGRLRT
jgi:hypothetical protein